MAKQPNAQVRPRRRLRVLRVGLFDARYARNRTTAAAFVAAGAEIADLHAPVIEQFGDRIRPAHDRTAFLRLGHAVLTGELRLLRRAVSTLGWADLVLCGYPGQWDVAFWAPVARRAGSLVVFDPLVSLTETFVEDRGLVPPGSWQARFLRWLDRRAFRAADVVLADTPQQAAYWAALAGVSLDRFLVVPVGADEETFDPAHRAVGDRPRDDPDCLRVLFYGTYSPLHGAERIVEAIHRLERAGERVALVMIGKGQCQAAVQQAAAALGLGDVRFIEWVPERELARWIGWADVVLGIFGATAKAGRVVPNKVYQAMAMGAAIVTRESPAIRWLAAGDECALLVPPADSEALARALVTLRDPERRARLGQAARRVFERAASTRARAQSLQPLVARGTGACRDRVERSR